MTAPDGCDKCNKSSLSLLLLRPSPIAKSGPLVPVGAAGVVVAPALVKGLLPTRLPTESRFVLRLLRAGYVHVYIEKPPSGVKNWSVFRVTEEADLVEQGSSLLNPNGSVVCPTKGHNASGLKTLNIPQAHLVTELWIAYSANLWSKALRDQNAAKPSLMQKIVLAGGSDNTFAPTAANLKANVLECALTALSINKAVVQDFSFNSLLKTGVEKMSADLTRAAGCHPKTKGKELAVVLRDPVGIAAELNTLRLRRNDLIRQKVAEPEIEHAICSFNAIRGIREKILDGKMLQNAIQVAPLCSKPEFDSKTWPPGAEWHPLTAEDKKNLKATMESEIYTKFFTGVLDANGNGRVVFLDHEERAAAWARKETAKTWKQLAPYHDQKASNDWFTAFNTQMKAEHYDVLARFEIDWRACCDDPVTRAYFANHFDENDPNDPLKLHSPGTVYARENDYVNSPAPISQGQVNASYIAVLSEDITLKTSYAVRALVANQKELIWITHQYLSGDGGADEEKGGGERDKTYDILREFEAMKRYSWMGDTVAFFGIGQLSAASAALFHTSIQTGLTATFGAKLQQLWGVQHAIEHARTAHLQASAKGVAPNSFILMTMDLDPAEAKQMKMDRAGQSVGLSNTQIKKHSDQHRKVRATLLIDVNTVRAAGGDALIAARNPANGILRMGPAATSNAIFTAGSTQVASRQLFLRLYNENMTRSAAVLGAVRTALASPIGKGISALPKDGRLAFGCIVVQAIGIYNSAATLEKETDPAKRREAFLCLIDSSAGFAGGLAQLLALGLSTYHVATAVPGAADRSLGLAGLKLLSNVMGVAGGYINFVAMREKGLGAEALGDSNALDYRISSYAFRGTAFTSLVGTVAVGAEALAQRSIGGIVVRTIATRLGAGAVAGALGATISGVGLVLLGAGMIYQIRAIAATPQPLQRWLSRSFFGKDPGTFFDGKRKDMFVRGDWQAELKGLEDAVKESISGDKKTEKDGA
jgi:hypothetical protein